MPLIEEKLGSVPYMKLGKYIYLLSFCFAQCDAKIN